jgi:hypothetical protein
MSCRTKRVVAGAACAALVGYLLINTGVVSDDFADMVQFRGKSLVEVLPPTGNFINVPVGHFTHHIWFHYFHLDNLVVVDLFKIAFTLVSLLLIGRFFALFVARATAFVIAMVFVFFPSHDAMPYSYAASGHVFAIAVYLYAYYSAERGRLALAFLLATTASFMVYGSTPTALGLFALFALRRQMTKAMVMLVPNLVYAAYFIYVSVIASVAPSRILEPLSVATLAKQYALQVVTFVDATLGPSMWLKLYFSFPQLTLLSWAVAVVVVGWLVLAWKDERPVLDPRLAISLAVVTLSSFAIFAATGRYPQLAFNLGNRTTLWGSLLLAYLVVLIPGPRPVRITVLAVLAVAMLGISDHWKAWSIHQQAVIGRIASNQGLRALGGGEVFVSGNQYSRFGPISHIEFLSEDWVPGSIFALVTSKDLRARTINRRFHYRAGHLVDGKYGTEIPVQDHITVYDSERDRVLRVDAEKINDYIGSLPEEKRHWTMLSDNRLVAMIKESALFLMPRLRGSV